MYISGEHRDFVNKMHTVRFQIVNNLICKVFVMIDGQRRINSYLNKDGEEDDSDDGSEEHVSQWEVVFIEQEAKGEGDGTSEATIGYYELVFGGQFDDAELVDDESQTNNTWKTFTFAYKLQGHVLVIFKFKICLQTKS